MNILCTGFNRRESDILLGAFEKDSPGDHLVFAGDLTPLSNGEVSFDLIIADLHGSGLKAGEIPLGYDDPALPIIVTFDDNFQVPESLNILDLVNKTDSALRAMPGIARRAMLTWELSRINLQLRDEIVDRRWMEDALKNVNRKFKNMVANIPGIIFQRAFDRDWTMYFVSDEVESVTGYAAADFVKDYNITFSGIIHGDDLARIEGAIRESVAARKPYSVEYRIIDRAGREKWVHEKGQGVFDDSGIVLWIDGSIFDITERIKGELEILAAKEVAESATRAKSDFLARMSHEIRTPMNIIAGLAELALETDADSTRLEHLRSIKETAEHIIPILDEILDFSKVESGHMTVDKVSFDLKFLLESVVRMMKNHAHRKGLYLRLSYSEGGITRFRCDETKLRQILINIIGNAIKFTDRGGITLSVEARGEPSGEPRAQEHLFTVEDTGIGIPEEKQELIFKKYRQAGGGDWRTRGTGLGLAITKDLVEMMKGVIWVESVPSRGSRFIFTLNLEVDQGLEGHTAGNDPDQKITLEPQRVLIAEDNPVNTRLLVHLLNRQGHSAATVGNGADVITRLGEISFDFLIMDIEMPGMDGLSVSRSIRNGMAGDANLRIPIIIVTGYAHPETEKKCLESGADGLLIKPVKSRDLMAEMARVKSISLMTGGMKSIPPIPGLHS